MTFHGKDHTNIATNHIKHSLKDFLDYFEEIFYETDLAGRIIYVSPTIQKLTGYTVQEVIGKSILEFYHQPEKRNEFMAALLQRGMVEDYELSLVDKNNRVRICSVTSKIQYDAKGNPSRILGILKDNSEKLKHLKDLEESEGKLRALFENAGAQIIYCNVEGKILLVNKRAADYLGDNPEHFKDKNIEEVYEKSLAIQLKEKLSQTVSMVRGHIFEFKVNDNHQDLWFLTNMQPITKDKGLITGVVIILNDITDRKDYENELQKLSMAIEKSTASLLITDKNGIITYVNPRFLEVRGISFEESTGKKAKFFDKKFLGADTYHELWNKLDQKETWSGEWKIHRKDGSAFWEEINITPVMNSENEIQNYIRIGMDISASKEFSEFQNKSLKNLEILNETSVRIFKLKSNEDIFKVIGDQLKKLIPDHNFILGSYDEKSKSISNRYIHVEQKLVSAFFSITNLENPFKIKSKIDNNSYCKLIKGQFLELNEGFHELTNGKISEKLSDSLIRLFSVKKIYRRGIVREGTLLGSFLIFIRKSDDNIDRDLLDTFFNQVSAGIERIRLEEELIKAKEKAEEMNSLKTAFLANMSHELRTPLNGILGFSELLVDQSKDEANSEMISIIHKSGLRLLETLNTILDFTMLESSSIIISYKKENIVAFLKSILNNYSKQADKKGLKIELQAPEDEPEIYIGKFQLEKILNHLISNAIKFTYEGKIIIRFSVKNKDKVIIEVRDTGIGIPESDLAYIFDEFRQSSEGFTRKFEGTGLGLTICKKFTELLGGSISVNSKLNKGSIFTLLLPMHTQDPNI